MIGSVLLACLIGASARAQEAVQVSSMSVEQRLERLERRQDALEGQQPPAPGLGFVTAGGADGTQPFSIRSFDGGNRLRIAGVLQVDDRRFLNQASQADRDEFLVRRARLYVEGVIGRHAEFRILPDFGDGQALLQEAWVDLDYFPQARLMAGKFKEPLGLERLTPEADTLFIERGLPSDVAPNRDEGAQLHGQISRVEYEAAVVDGVPDGGITTGGGDNTNDFVGRVFAKPGAGLGVGMAGSYGRAQGTSAAPNLAAYSTEGQQAFFSYATGAQADGARWRLSPQGNWYGGPFGLLAEYVMSDQAVSKGTAEDDIAARSWQAAGSVMLTGEKRGPDGVAPLHKFDPSAGGWGAFELAVRYSELWIDRSAFPVFASPSVSSRAARAWTGGVNWFLNRHVRFAVNYNNTRLDGGSRGLETSVFSRLQLVF